MTQWDGHVEPIANAPRQQPQPVSPPQQPALPDQLDGQPAWRPAPPPDDSAWVRRRIEPPALVTAAGVLCLVLGAVLLVVALGGLGSLDDLLRALFGMLFPVLMVVGGILAFRGRRGLLTTAAVFLLITGVVLLFQVLGSDQYAVLPASIEVGVRLAAGVLILVFSRVKVATTFFETAEELRFGRKDADFFR